MYNLLFVYTNDLSGAYGGSDVTRNALKHLSSSFNVIDFFIYSKPTKISILVNSLFGYLKSSYLKYLKIRQLLKKDCINIVYFDDCINGKIVKKIKKRFPKVFIVTHFHNNEINYYRDLVKQDGFLYTTLYLASIPSQNASLKYSDLKIFITEEDRQSMNSIENSIVIPVTKTDNYAVPNPSEHTSDYILFFGNSFFPNNEAVNFIIEKIAPFVNKQFLIAGNKMDETFKNVILPDNVKIIGFVEDIKELFLHAVVFFCPIFSGSGMKVKIADALMFGKTIIATEFAAIGYEKQADVFFIGKTKEDFIEILSNISESVSYNKQSRELFKLKYDADIANVYYKPVVEKYLEFKKMCNIKDNENG